MHVVCLLFITPPLHQTQFSASVVAPPELLYMSMIAIPVETSGANQQFAGQAQ
jgi:hypothetical protein